MNRTLVLATLGAALAASGVHAAGSIVDKAFGNTLISTYPDGRTAELWLQRGGAYFAEGRRHDQSSGRWSIKGDKLCLRQSKPIGAPFSFCTPIPSGGLGSTWSAKAVTGEQVSVRLAKGPSTR